MQEEKRQTVQAERQIDPLARQQFQQVFQGAQALPSATIGQAAGSRAGIAGLQDVAAQPGIAGGASFLNQFLGPEGGLGTSLDTLQGTAAGDLVQSNPALLQALEANRSERTGDILSRFTQAGRTGLNPAVAQAITEANARAELPVLAQDISQQQARQQQAAQFLPGLFGNLSNIATFAPGLQLQAGATQEAFDRRNKEAELRRSLAALQAQSGAAQSFGGLTGDTMQTSTQPGPSDFGQIVGLGAMGLGSLAGRGMFGAT